MSDGGQRPDGPTPAALGYSMPAEWAPHRGTWLSWPHKEASWPGKFEPVPDIFAEMVRHLSAVEEVHINVAGPEMEAQVRGVLGASELTDGGKSKGSWWGWSQGKEILEWLFWIGDVTTARRRNFERLYDLTERVVPEVV